MVRISKYTFIFVILFSITPLYSQLAGFAGVFTRMGFGARGISMGNAMSSVTSGDVVGYYNPALSSFQNEHLINVGYSFLSFDRGLNFLSYTKNFKLPNQPDEGGAGITFSVINSGVTNIDGRDPDGFQTEEYYTSENQFTFAPAIQVSPRVSIGVAFKFYWSRLFEGVTATSLGFDGGVLFKASDRLNLALTVKDINSKYEWKTNDLYGQYGNTTLDKFPRLHTLGVSYLLPNNLGLVSADYEVSNKKSQILRMGYEITPMKDISFRAGFDRFDLTSSDKFGNSNVMFGIGYQKEVKNYVIGLNYSFVMEAYSNKPFQTLTAVFKIK
ncbi:MAG: hypothetical protein EHM58_10855 [Ignavibacteriae bacterium]|nr:MAG: hypothetical protein EHM58_10855 [Ignavibacteriota bacterium]